MLAQLTAAGIFVVMFGLIVWDKIERHIVTLACGAATLVLVFGVCMRDMGAAWKTLALEQIFTVEFWYHIQHAGTESGGINWATIIFIAGMMTMVEGMSSVGFFRWLCMAIAKLVRYRPVPILIAFMIVSAVLSMFIDSITVILFLAAVTTELAKIVHFDPVPVILAEIFCANLGGSATMCGDPPNIIIGTTLGYSFMDFLGNTGLIAGISLIIVIVYFYFCFRKKLSAGGEGIGKTGTLVTETIAADKNNPPVKINDPVAFYFSAAIFALAVVLLVTHAYSGLTVATIGVIIAVLTLMAGGKKSFKLLKQLDYKTLLFFIGLFIVVSGLEQTGALEVIAEFIGSISGGNPMIMAAIIIWISGIASAFVDNIPFAATMIPVIKSLAAMHGADLSVLAWSLAMGTDIGGSATPIGASANVVGISVLSQKGYKVSWGRYCLYMVPASIIVLLISNAFIWLRYF
ncbi:MAG: anion permease [Firmicutes bacterium]|nr:anion permease [Bacillota bacterium]